MLGKVEEFFFSTKRKVKSKIPLLCSWPGGTLQVAAIHTNIKYSFIMKSKMMMITVQ